jgi:hypothetical protein
MTDQHQERPPEKVGPQAREYRLIAETGHSATPTESGWFVVNATAQGVAEG